MFYRVLNNFYKKQILLLTFLQRRIRLITQETNQK